jgi:hypothetical protein
MGVESIQPPKPFQAEYEGSIPFTRSNIFRHISAFAMFFVCRELCWIFFVGYRALRGFFAAPRSVAIRFQLLHVTWLAHECSTCVHFREGEAQMFFSKQALNEMSEAQRAIRGKYESMLMKHVMLPLKDATAKEYATQGFPRRLGVMAHCIHNVFTTLPPEKEEVPSKTQLYDATVNIQAFLVNAFGCIDNLARIWVHEKPVTTARGKPLPRGKSDWLSITRTYGRRCLGHSRITSQPSMNGSRSWVTSGTRWRTEFLSTFLRTPCDRKTRQRTMNSSRR